MNREENILDSTEIIKTENLIFRQIEENRFTKIYGLIGIVVMGIGFLLYKLEMEIAVEIFQYFEYLYVFIAIVIFVLHFKYIYSKQKKEKIFVFKSRKNILMYSLLSLISILGFIFLCVNFEKGNLFICFPLAVTFTLLAEGITYIENKENQILIKGRRKNITLDKDEIQSVKTENEITFIKNSGEELVIDETSEIIERYFKELNSFLTKIKLKKEYGT
jgi:uncharacterized membrane protein YcgQ (UPF0703/DUF1980 family)